MPQGVPLAAAFPGHGSEGGGVHAVHPHQGRAGADPWRHQGLQGHQGVSGHTKQGRDVLPPPLREYIPPMILPRTFTLLVSLFQFNSIKN